jgi:hypothetical protein
LGNTLLSCFSVKLKLQRSFDSLIESRPIIEITADEKIKQDKISINLSITATEVLRSDGIAATGPMIQIRIKVMSNPAPAEQYFNTLDDRCSQTTTATASG